MAFKYLSSFQKVIFLLSVHFISKHGDFLDGGNIRMMFCTLSFTIFNLVLIIEQHFGFDRHGYFPSFANSFISKTT